MHMWTNRLTPVVARRACLLILALLTLAAGAPRAAAARAGLQHRKE